MRNTLKILPLMLGIMLFFTQCEKEALDTGYEIITYDILFPDCNGSTPLYAGAGQNIIENGFQVGIVEWGISPDGETLYVRYLIQEEGWSLTQTHFWVGDNIADLPQNAPPGQLGNSEDHGFVSNYEYVIDISSFELEPGDPLYIAAHAVVVFEEFDGIDGLEGFEDLPIFGAMLSGIRANSTSSYHWLNLSDAGYFDGTDYDSYCIDPTKPVGAGRATLYSSLSDDVPASLVDDPNYNQVNWIINNVSVGDTKVNGTDVDPAINYADIQMAIWELFFGPPDRTVPDNWANTPGISGVRNASNPTNAALIVAAANDNDNYSPGCGDKFVILVVPENPDSQPHLIWKPINCPDFDSETAWAFGDFTFIEVNKANKWGWIFEITKCPPPTP